MQQYDDFTTQGTHMLGKRFKLCLNNKHQIHGHILAGNRSEFRCLFQWPGTKRSIKWVHQRLIFQIRSAGQLVLCSAVASASQLMYKAQKKSHFQAHYLCESVVIHGRARASDGRRRPPLGDCVLLVAIGSNHSGTLRLCVRHLYLNIRATPQIL